MNTQISFTRAFDVFIKRKSKLCSLEVTRLVASKVESLWKHCHTLIFILQRTIALPSRLRRASAQWIVAMCSSGMHSTTGHISRQSCCVFASLTSSVDMTSHLSCIWLAVFSSSENVTNFKKGYRVGTRFAIWYYCT